MSQDRVFLVPVGLPDYSAPQMHDIMLSDEPRMAAYRNAIEAHVTRDSVVIDMGAGTGILSLMAARAGARRVYAIEPTSVIDVAREISRRNGFDRQITFIRKSVQELTSTDLPEPADVLVSEWMGNLGVLEPMLGPLLETRDRFLRPGGALLPDRITIYLALAETADLHGFFVGKWARPTHGLDYGYMAAIQSAQVQVAPLSPAMLMSAAAPIVDIDLGAAPADQAVRWSAEVELEATRSGLCHGLCGWFTVSFPHGGVLDTSPFAEPTHWLQCFLPLEHPVPCVPGTRARVRLSFDGRDPSRLAPVHKEVEWHGP